MTTRRPYHLDNRTGRDWASAGVWTAGLAVAVGAAAATARGLYEVVAAAGNPPAIAGLYPLITDGLALVAYSATTRLSGRGRSYAWAIVVLAAGLSGLAQATYLAGNLHTAPTWLRAGVGGWPAIAAAIVAHLLYLLGTAAGRPGTVDVASNGHRPRAYDGRERADRTDGRTRPELNIGPAVPPLRTGRTENKAGRTTTNPAYVQPGAHGPRTERSNGAVRTHPGRSYTDAYDEPAPYDSVTSTGSPTSARERALRAARDHEAAHGELPTTTVLMEAADVGRGTAGSALKHLRAQGGNGEPHPPANNSTDR